MIVAYLVNQYPSVSHSFIRREIMALERAGMTVHRLSIRKSAHGYVDAADKAEAQKTGVLLDAPGALLRDTLVVALTRPVRFVGALRLALGSAWRTTAGLKHLAYLCEASAVARRCVAVKAQHLHAHFGTNPATVARLCHKLGGPPYSFTIHGPDEWDSPRDYQLADKTIDAKFVACISHFTAARLKRVLPIDQWGKAQVVRCGIDGSFLEEPQTRAWGPSDTLVFVGRLSAQKGVPLLIDAFAQLAKTHPRARLTLCGDGEMRGEVEKRIAELGLSDRVTITGWLDSAGVHEHLRSARALVMASFAEGLPVVIMEAMALTRPVITTSIAGVPELVKDGENGWLVPAGDVDALVRAMAVCLDADADTLLAMGRRGRDAVTYQHAIDRAVVPLKRALEA